MNNLPQLDKKYLWHPFTPMKLWLQNDPLVIERGKGSCLYDVDGNRYLDGVSSLWCNVHGHCHPTVDDAIRQQLDKIAHSTLLGLASEQSVILAEQLAAVTPTGLDRIFYSDSGATAVEIAVKIAFQYWRNCGIKNRQTFISLKQSYHGDTMGSVSVGGIDLFHRIFGKLTFDSIFSDSPHPYRFDGNAEQCRDHCLKQMENILQQQAESVAAIIVEPLVQGASGIIVHPDGFLKGVARLAEKYDVLLITDEVATGFGKTQTMFACQQENVIPDILCCAKGITAGYLPLAATVVSENIFDAFLSEPWEMTTFYHGHTYTGNALACAAALANLKVFRDENTLENLQPKIKLIDDYLKQFAQLDFVGDVRHRGVMTGIEIVKDKQTKDNFDYKLRLGAKICRQIRDRGVILRPIGDVIIIMPPLSISMDELTELLETVQSALKNISAVI